MSEEIRWQQRFNNYRKALKQLSLAVKLHGERELSELERQGMIQAFEYTHELAWNCLKDYLVYKGQQNLHGSRDATRKAISVGLLDDDQQWMNMIKSRNLSSHTYNKATADQLVDSITNHYHDLFLQLQNKLSSLVEN
ncbi:nucleotidyltransferase [Piscirickettsiaceae bacterium NZ-RLO2]|uniref:nucleotidyltransferase substrate binding protein n=1 Tax=Piscirickettsia salmonis TaxID=1238 RepID=UPI000F087144|nr:nucleotidyltransferase [Piscirickettsiaceae bacterium NZ-RLO2]